MKYFIFFLRVIILILCSQICIGMADNTHLNQGTAAYNKRDFVQAVKEFKIAALEGNSVAQFLLSEMYFRGKGVPQDYKQTLKWCRLSAAQGDDLALNRLGWLYYYGEGVPQDYEEAFRWFERTSYLPYSQIFLGKMYANGYYVKKDIKKSKEYFKKACDFGLTAACQDYENIIAMDK